MLCLCMFHNYVLKCFKCVVHVFGNFGHNLNVLWMCFGHIVFKMCWFSVVFAGFAAFGEICSPLFLHLPFKTSLPVSLVESSCHVVCSAWGPGVETTRWTEVKTSLQYEFLRSRVFSWELMSCALGAWCRHHKVNRAQNRFTIIILFTSYLIVFLFVFVCNLAWRPDRPLKPIEQENCQKKPRGGVQLAPPISSF